MIRRRKRKPDFFEEVIARKVVLPAHSRQNGLQFLVSLFSEIRPGTDKMNRNPEKNLQRVTEQLRQHKIILANTQHALLSQLLSSNLTNAITENGIPLATALAVNAGCLVASVDLVSSIKINPIL